jgi:hypothetical protein
VIPWKGPAVALAVFVAMSRWGPATDDCVLRERTLPLPPPPTDRSSGWVEPTDLGDSGPAAADPFALSAPPRAPTSAAPVARVAGPTPSRPWRVTGLVGQRAAVLVRSDGSSVVVSIGQVLDSAKVVGISSAGVELEDRGGRFLLKVR